SSPAGSRASASAGWAPPPDAGARGGRTAWFGAFVLLGADPRTATAFALLPVAGAAGPSWTPTAACDRPASDRAGRRALAAAFAAAVRAARPAAARVACARARVRRGAGRRGRRPRGRARRPLLRDRRRRAGGDARRSPPRDAASRRRLPRDP